MEIHPYSKKILYLLFALSGFCALVYEILWTKYLSLTFGTTILAVSTVAAVFMGGLALGSYLLGRHADRETNLLRIYAFLELGIAVTALLFAPTLELVEAVYIALSRSLPTHPAISTAFHFLFSALLLLPPSACMGGTFPLMCRFFARKKCGGQIGRLYALNTLGATLGAFGAGFFLIPALGLSTTGYLAVFTNLAIAAGAFALARRIGATSPRDVSQAKRPDQPLQASRHRLLLVGIGLIGFFSLAYEILWTRVLLLFLGNTSYAFSLMLSAYLVGIALGGAVYARKVRPELDEKRVFVILTVLMGLSILVTAPFYDRLAHLFLFAHQASGERWWHLSMLSFFIVFLIMCVPTVLSGSLLPAAVAILDPGKNHTGEGVGLIVLHNTLGAVLGSLAAGFLLIPLLGVQDSFRLLAGLNLLLALALYRHYRRGDRRLRFAALLACGGLLLALVPISWDQGVMNSGVYIYAPKYARMGGIDAVLAAEKVVKVIEGTDTTVAVHESLDGQIRFFTVNGKTDGGTGRDMSTQVLVGQLPLLLHPDPRDVLVIGLGTGVTLKGMSEHPTRRIDCVEISPGVVEASSYFAEANGHALRDPKVNLFVRDGRNLLLTRPERYDVIVSEPSNPWQAGNANLFTADFYRLAAQRLKPSGLFCQWIGLYDITPQNLKVACNTFLRTFPRAMVFKAGTDLIMVGALHELAFDYQRLSRRMATPGVRGTLANIGIDSPGDLVAMHYLYSEAPLSDFARGAALNTDDRPILEYSARYNLGEKTLGEFQRRNMENLLATQGKVFLPLVNLGNSGEEVAAALRDLGKGYAGVGRKSEAELFMRKASEVEQKRAGIAPKVQEREEG
jgi:spermidine synthase